MAQSEQPSGVQQASAPGQRITGPWNTDSVPPAFGNQRMIAQKDPPGDRVLTPREQALADEQEAYNVQLIPPGPQRLFRLESERSLQERMRQEARQRPQAERIEFPEEPVISTQQFAGRFFPPMHEVVEPSYLCYHNLLFEDRNSERYGWDLGFVQPFLSAAEFYADVLLLPYHAFTDPCRCYDCDAGYCLPGDPVPYLLYPPALSLTGSFAEAAAALAIVAVLP